MSHPLLQLLLFRVVLDYKTDFVICYVISVSLGTFSIDDENVDDDLYDRLGPGTRPSSTAGNINTLADRLRGRVLYCPCPAKVNRQNVF